MRFGQTKMHSNRLNSKLTSLYIRNFAANLIGNLIIALLNIVTPLEFLKDWVALLSKDGSVLVPIFFIAVCIIVTILQYLIQRPISRYLTCLGRAEKIQISVELKAQRRLLNLPVFLGLTNLGMWLFLDIIFTPLMYALLNMTLLSLFYNFFRILMVGLIASFISFFLIDDFVREKLVPILFPEGQLAATSGTVRISILKRIRVLFGVGTNAPMVLLCVTIAFAIWELDEAIVTTTQFSRGIITFSGSVFIIFIIMSLTLNLLVAKSILRPIDDMIGIARNVRKGQFDQKVRVVSNDELGIMGEGMNAMTDGLIERDRLRRGLYLAQEIQQALLPRKCPAIDGLDIAARSLYCDETGGDYYDFIGNDNNQLNAVIGDVSGHGISSAILMAHIAPLYFSFKYFHVDGSEPAGRILDDTGKIHPVIKYIAALQLVMAYDLFHNVQRNRSRLSCRRTGTSFGRSLLTETFDANLFPRRSAGVI